MLGTPAQGLFCVLSANERRRYNVTSSLIGWAHVQIDPCPGFWFLPFRVDNIHPSIHPPICPSIHPYIHVHTYIDRIINNHIKFPVRFPFPGTRAQCELRINTPPFKIVTNMDIFFFAGNTPQSSSVGKFTLTLTRDLVRNLDLHHVGHADQPRQYAMGTQCLEDMGGPHRETERTLRLYQGCHVV